LNVAPSPQTPDRRKDTVYKINMFLWCQYAWIAVLMLAFQVSKWEKSDMFPEGTVSCNIGLQIISSTPLIIYDAIFTFLLNSELKIGCNMVMSETMRRVARRNSRGAMVSSCVSLLNILSLAVRNKAGMPSEMCFGFCAIDVFVNIRTIQYVMNPRDSPKKGRGVGTTGIGLTTTGGNVQTHAGTSKTAWRTNEH